MTELLRIYA